ncbi:PREDICTED: alkylglycerol monooxygenase-like [Branchiostoma belcheri]|uniref:Alkylglycerol monooxygenase n=1 Tax=Branchiostoma belcheri TaxID=7741 RepID=A0A6P4XVB0_BRABE|nr:PREDICTED: alkylglycerol monooxygenase-like [Branchiostoma belcheri]
MSGLQGAQMAPSTAPTFSTGLRQIFYLVTPAETTFEALEDVPNYVKQAMPFVVLLFLVETLVAWIQKRTTPRFNNVIASGGVALVTQIVRLLTVGVEMMAYVWLYRHLRLVDMSWDSPLTWWTAFFGVEFGYYWSHRLHHEVNILWAAHQVHHSSDDYNILSSLRTSAFQRCSSFLLYLPLALVVPPAAFLVHYQLNLLYQAWLHTEVVGSLGPLEYILNTPTHHRVHHGRNHMGKNYGGTLIIWDRMFGTFHQESGPLVYGLRAAVNTWDPVWIQFHHFVCIWHAFFKTPGLWNKTRVLFAGPGRTLRYKPQLESTQEFPKRPTPKYDSKVSMGWVCYVLMHFALALLTARTIPKDLSIFGTVGKLASIMWTLSSIAAILDCRPIAPIMELSRCMSVLGTGFLLWLSGALLTSQPVLTVVTLACHAASVVIWTVYLMKSPYVATRGKIC